MAAAKPNFADRDLWEIRKGVAVFDEHERPERRGDDGAIAVPYRHFRKKDLEDIAEKCNARDGRGQPCPLTIGHTVDSDDETEQPEIVGYARNFRVEDDPKQGKCYIRADFFVRRDRIAEAQTYPRVSVEHHWKGDDVFDPIALIRRTPKRDLGQWTYARPPGGVLRYAMDAPPSATDPLADPTQAPDANSLEPELMDKVKDAVVACMKDPQVIQMMATAMMGAMQPPAPPDAAPPPAGGGVPGDAERFASEAERIRYTRQQGEIEQLKKDRDTERLRYARAECEGVVKGLIFEGYDFGGTTATDRAARTEKAVQKFMRLDETGRKEYEAEIRECYQKAPVGGPMLRTYEPSPAGGVQDDGPTEGETLAAVQYMRKSGKSDFDEALKYVREKTA